MSTSVLSAKAAIRIRRPPRQAFDAFADAGAMSKFWFTRRDNGLRAGASVTWYLGSAPDAMAFDVRVKEIDAPRRIVIEWEQDCGLTEVTWTFLETAQGDTMLTIEESGFVGTDEAIALRALDSTAGFNQVIVAAKALIEHGVGLNVVADHA